MSHAGNDISVKRVKFKTSVNPTSTTQLVVGDIPNAGKRGLYLDGELAAAGTGATSTLQTVTATGNTTTICTEFNNAYTAISTDLVSNVDVKIDQLYNVEIDNESSGEILVLRDQGSSGTQINSNPSNPMITRKINHAIKMRDFWMPFGPSILTSRMPEYVKDSRNSPYMILAFDTTEKRNDLIAAIHPFDFTCRPQSVDSDHNPNYEKLIKSFESKTGIGAVLNTSFNLHGFPIVYDPETAISTFMNSKLDVLSIGNYLLKK